MKTRTPLPQENIIRFLRENIALLPDTAYGAEYRASGTLPIPVCENCRRLKPAKINLMKSLFTLIFIVWSLVSFSQPMTVLPTDGSLVEVLMVSDSVRQNLLATLEGGQDNSIRHTGTARTYRLKDGRILVEFFDRQAVVFKSDGDLERAGEVRFFKPYIDYLKKNITYKIVLSYERGVSLAQQSGKRLARFRPDNPQWNDFEVYELPSGQILALAPSANPPSATVYQNLKGLAGENSEVEAQLYGDLDTASARFVSGDPLWDYDPGEFLVWPRDERKIVQNHRLKLVETKVYVSDFYSNLYRSAAGYFVLIDDFNQKNAGGKQKIGIGTARVFASLEEVRKKQAQYVKHKNEPVRSEHFFQQISDSYGKGFPDAEQQLIDSLALVLNIDKEQLTFDSSGMAIVDEAIHWNHSNYALFDRWFPGVLAYYGQCYRQAKQDGEWVMKKTTDLNPITGEKYDVWVPHLVGKDGRDAFDVYEFYKSLLEWPLPLKIAGDWDGHLRDLIRNR